MLVEVSTKRLIIYINTLALSLKINTLWLFKLLYFSRYFPPIYI